MGRCRRAGQTAISHHRSHHEGTRAFSASYSRRAARSAASASPPDAAVDGAAAAPGGVSGGADGLRAAARSASGVGAPSAASLSAAPSLSLRSLAPRFGMIERLRLMYALEPCAREGSSAEGGAFSALVPSRDDDDDDERGVSRRRCGDDGGGKWLRWSGEMRRDRARSRDRRRRAPARCGLAGCWRPKAARARTCSSAGRPALTPGERRGGREIVRDGSRDGSRAGSRDRARSITRSHESGWGGGRSGEMTPGSRRRRGPSASRRAAGRTCRRAAGTPEVKKTAGNGGAPGRARSPRGAWDVDCGPCVGGRGVGRASGAPSASRA